MNEDNLNRMISAAVKAYEKLSPELKNAHDREQRRSFLRGMCPSHWDYEAWCGHVDKWCEENGYETTKPPRYVTTTINSRILARKMGWDDYHFDGTTSIRHREDLADLSPRFQAVVRELRSSESLPPGTWKEPGL